MGKSIGIAIFFSIVLSAIFLAIGFACTKSYNKKIAKETNKDELEKLRKHRRVSVTFIGFGFGLLVPGIFMPIIAAIIAKEIAIHKEKKLTMEAGHTVTVDVHRPSLTILTIISVFISVGVMVAAGVFIHNKQKAGEASGTIYDILWVVEGIGMGMGVASFLVPIVVTALSMYFGI